MQDELVDHIEDFWQKIEDWKVNVGRNDYMVETIARLMALCDYPEGVDSNLIKGYIRHAQYRWNHKKCGHSFIISHLEQDMPESVNAPVEEPRRQKQSRKEFSSSDKKQASKKVRL